MGSHYKSVEEMEAHDENVEKNKIKHDKRLHFTFLPYCDTFI